MFMIKKVFALFFVIIVLILCSCERKSSIDNFETTIIPNGGGFYEALNDNGVFYDKQGVLYMLDPMTGISAPLCSKVNCDHRGNTRVNINPTCDAYFAQAVGYSAIIGDKLYCLVRIPENVDRGKGYFTKEFYRAEKNGTERKLLFRADDIQYGVCGRYEDGYFLYGYYNEETPEGEELDKEEVGMCVVNLKTEEMTRIRLDNCYGGRIWMMTIYQGQLYYGLSYMTENLNDYDFDYLSDPGNYDKLNGMYISEVWKYDIKTGEKEMVFESGLMPELSLGYGHIYYSADGKKHIVRNLTDGEEYSINKDKSGIPMAICSEGIIFIEDDHIEIWRYGTEEIDKIGNKETNQKIYIKGITSKWVYAFILDKKKKEEMKSVYCSKEDFMKGRFEWCEYDIK